MNATERSVARKPAIRLPKVSEITLLGVIAVGFLLLHLLTAILLMPGSRGADTPQGEARAVTTD